MVLLSLPLIRMVLAIISNGVVAHLNVLLVYVKLLLWLLSIQQDSLGILLLLLLLLHLVEILRLISVLLRACIGAHILGPSKGGSSPR